SSPVMQWRFDASMLDAPLPGANPIMAEMSAGFCSRMLEDFGDESELVKKIREACLNSVGGIPSLVEMADRLHLSSRTLQRRLAETGRSYQDVIDAVRQRLAIEYLERTSMSMEEIAERCGFSDASNFRKAFAKWTGRSTTFYRRGRPH